MAEEIVIGKGYVHSLQRVGRIDLKSSYVRSTIQLTEKEFEMEYGESAFNTRHALIMDKEYEVVLREVKKEEEPERVFREE